MVVTQGHRVILKCDEVDADVAGIVLGQPQTPSSNRARIQLRSESKPTCLASAEVAAEFTERGKEMVLA